MRSFFMFCAVFTGLLFSSMALEGALAQENTGLYKLTTMRAAPGKLKALIDFLREKEQAGFYEKEGLTPPMIMRHSQGDQWDLLLLQPIGSYEKYFSTKDSPSPARTDYRENINSLTVFREELFTHGPSAEKTLELYEDNSFFHIEMFAALPGKHDDLVREREMENEYLVLTGRSANLIFIGDFGSDIDSLTIGFYKSLEEFAAPAPVSSEEADAAAKKAGFEGRDTIGFYLREFLAYHHDTLATKVE